MLYSCTDFTDVLFHCSGPIGSISLHFSSSYAFLTSLLMQSSYLNCGLPPFLQPGCFTASALFVVGLPPSTPNDLLDVEIMIEKSGHPLCLHPDKVFVPVHCYHACEQVRQCSSADYHVKYHTFPAVCLQHHLSK